MQIRSGCLFFLLSVFFLLHLPFKSDILLAVALMKTESVRFPSQRGGQKLKVRCGDTEETTSEPCVRKPMGASAPHFPPRDSGL